MKLLTIVGARPQFIKAAMVSRAILRRNAMSGSTLITEQILHTGQHYDPDMSEIFFRQLEIPEPSFRLNCGGMTHAEMTGTMLIEIEKILLSELPDALLVYGDTNSTLAGALAAAKLRIPVIHVEAGLRSFNQAMPEELNRILTDHASSLLLYPTRSALLNLQREGLADRACEVGDVMYDAALCFGFSRCARVPASGWKMPESLRSCGKPPDCCCRSHSLFWIWSNLRNMLHVF